jgi:hypothetical protein
MELANAKALQLAAGQTVRADIQIVRQTGVRLSGRVVQPAGDAPPPGTRRATMIYLTRKESGNLNPETRLASVDKERYEIADILPGAYDLTALTQEVTEGNPYGTPALGAARTVEVGTQELAGVDLTMRPLSETLATINYQEGCSPADLTIQLMGRMISTPQILAKAGAKSVTLPRLAPGNVRISVSTREPSPQGLRATSIRLGDREALQSGFAAPANGEALTITMGCNTAGGVR